MNLNEFIKSIFEIENKKKKIPDLEKQIKVFCEVLPKYSISDNKNRLCSFLGQLYIESAGFTVLEEKLYQWQDVDRFMSIFPTACKKITHMPAREFIKNLLSVQDKNAKQKAIADFLYDGFCGRGYIQLTWKDNYKKISNVIFGNDLLVKQPELLKEYEYGLAAACVFWNENKINQFADILDIDSVTLKINGKAKLHLKERTEKTKEYLTILNKDSEFVIY